MSNGQIPAEQVSGLAAAIDAVVDAIPAPVAADVEFTPAGGVTSTDVQAAVVEVRAAIDTAIADLKDGVDPAYDTLLEIAAQLGDDEDAIAALVTSLAGKLDAEQVRDLVGTLLVAGSNVSIAVDDAGDTVTISATDTNTTDPEVVRDTMAAALVAGSNVTITPDDTANTITIASTGGGGGGPATTRWEVVVTGNPAEAVTTVDGSDWLYVEVPI